MIFVEENNAQFIKAQVGEGASEAASSNPLFFLLSPTEAAPKNGTA